MVNVQPWQRKGNFFEAKAYKRSKFYSDGDFS